MTRVRLGRAATIGICLFLTTSAVQAEEVSAAQRLFDLGRHELNRGEYEAACTHLRQSDELDPAPGTKLNLGECETLRGRLIVAWGLFARVEHELSKDDVRSPVARQKREGIEARLGRLAIHFAGAVPSQTRVQIQSRNYLARDLTGEVLVEPGTVEVVVTEPGRAERAYVVSITAAATSVLNVEASSSASALPVPAPATRAASLAPPPASVNPTRIATMSALRQPAAAPAARAASLAPPPATPHVADREHRPANYGYALLGGGVVVTALGGILGLLTLDAKRTNEDHCDELAQHCDATGRHAAERGRLFGALTTVAWAVGGVGLALGTYSLVTSRRPAPSGAALFVHATDQSAEVSAEYGF
jgi:hypothetical protein